MFPLFFVVEPKYCNNSYASMTFFPVHHLNDILMGSVPALQQFPLDPTVEKAETDRF